jgi:hypothetical protein
VDVRAGSGVIGQIPARVIRIFVDHDRIAVPAPIIHIVIIVRRNAEEPVVKPEAVAVSSSEVILMAASKTAGETAVLPRMIEVIVGIVTAGIVPDPSVIVVDVRSFRVTRLIAERPAVSFLRAAFRRAVVLRTILGSAILSAAVIGRAIFRPAIFGSLGRSSTHGRRPMRRDVTATHIARAAALLFATLCLTVIVLLLSKCNDGASQKQRKGS